MNGKPQRRVTSTDVAREAGVARSTVSYVLNRTPHQTIPEETRRRVLDAAERLNYTPSAAARTLKRGRSNVVLCIFQPWPLGSAAGRMMAELTTTFAEQGLALVTYIEDEGRLGVDSVWNEISPAAVLSYHRIVPAVERAMRSAGVLSVMALFSGEATGPSQTVRPDVQIGRLQADHLIAAGHRRIAYAHPESALLRDFVAPRLDGVRSACEEAGIALSDDRTVAMDAVSAAAAIEHWRALPQPVTAVCAYNDDMALALLAGARLAGVAVPAELAIIGADDIPAASLISPSLTSIAIDHATEARRIVETVVATLAGREPDPASERAELFTVVVRETA